MYCVDIQKKEGALIGEAVEKGPSRLSSSTVKLVKDGES